MINLRYHIVSLTAVFLALGLGILAGTTVIDQEVVKGLRANTDALQKDLNEMRAQIGVLERQIDVYEGFSDAVVPPLLQGLLTGRAVVVVTDGQTPGDLVRSITESLTLAGARRPARLTLTDRWSLDQPATAQQLAAVLGTSVTERDELVSEGATQLAARLGGSSDPKGDGDLIRALENSGFLDLNDLQTGSFPSANALVVVVTSGLDEATPGEDTFFIPFVRRLTSLRIVGVAEAMGVPRSFVEKVRGDAALARSICTVDHVDSVAGRLSLVYALRDLGEGRRAAHYGVRGGAQAVAPDIGSA